MIAITGAAGLVGGNLVRALLAQGMPVRALVHNDRRALQGLDVEITPGSLGDLESLKRAFGGVEMVFHLASLISLRLDNWDVIAATNVEGTRNVVRACIQCGVRRLVHFSSIHALQAKPLDQPLDETRARVTSPAAPPYDHSKALSEEIVRRATGSQLESVILNPTAIVGPYDFRPSLFGQALIALTQGRIPALVPGGFDWVDVRDVVAGAIAAAWKAPTGAQYILSGHWRSVRTVAEQAAEFSGKRPPRLTAPLWLAGLAAPLMSKFYTARGEEPLFTKATLSALKSNRQISHARASKELGYEPRPFQQTMGDTLQWFSEHGYLDSRIPSHKEASKR